MKVNILLGKPTSTDITIDDMLEQWKGLDNIEGIEYTIKRYENFPTVEQFNSLIDEDADAVLGVWITKAFINESFFKTHPNIKYLAGLAHGMRKSTSR